MPLDIGRTVSGVAARYGIHPRTGGTIDRVPVPAKVIISFLVLFDDHPIWPLSTLEQTEVVGSTVYDVLPRHARSSQIHERTEEQRPYFHSASASVMPMISSWKPISALAYRFLDGALPADGPDRSMIPQIGGTRSNDRRTRTLAHEHVAANHTLQL